MCPSNRPVDNTEKWPETWLGLQMAYDLWRARAQADEIKVEKLGAA